MKFKPLFLGLTLISFSANANEVNQHVNWQDISSTPMVNEKVFQPINNDEKSDFIQNEITNFDFLSESIDKRVFYSFDAKIRVLNKYTDKFFDHNLKNQEHLSVNKFNVTVKSCAIVPIDNVDNELAFIQIEKDSQIVFKGWMSNLHKTLSFPELREIYINLISCKKIEQVEEPTATE